MSEPTQHFFESQRLRLSYWSWGNEGATPLLFVHGGRDHARSFDRVAEAFRDEYHVAALDLRGHGDSDWAIGGYYSVAEQVVDLQRMIEVLGGSAIVVAHSFGGRITFYTAGAFPGLFRAIVGIEGTGSERFARHYGRPLTEPEQMRNWVERVRGFEGQSPRPYPTLEAARDRMVEVNPRLEPEFALQLARYATQEAEGGLVWKFDNWVHGRTAEDLYPEKLAAFWQAVECPVLHLIGSDSHLANEMKHRDGAAQFRDAEVVVVPEAGHWVHHDQLDSTVREIRRFLQERVGAGRPD